MATKKKTAAKKPALKKAPSTLGTEIEAVIALLREAKTLAGKSKPDRKAIRAKLNEASAELTKVKNSAKGDGGNDGGGTIVPGA